VTLPPLRPSRSAVAVVALLAWPAGALAADQLPAAGFSVSPEDPPAGHRVTFESSSCDPDGRIVRHAWDFDGDGAFDDGDGPVVFKTFPRRGPHDVGLEVTAAGGATDRTRRTVFVDTEYVLPQPEEERLMSPYPVVRIAGQLTRRGARIRVLSISRAPTCAVVRVSCRGRSCPVRSVSRYMGRRGQLRFKRFQRRLRAGAVLTVRVSKGDTIGKYTQFRIRSAKAPRRRDRCLQPGETKGSACPRG
jgi:PKD repeat protein